jgi:hypothetical protein
MKKYLKCQSGVSLVELVASIPLALIVIFLLSMVLINFITSYQEVKLYLQLQEELFSTMEVIRYGFLYKKFTDSAETDPKFKRPVVGLMTANTVEMSIQPYTINLSQQGGYFAKYYASGGKFLLDLRHPNMSETGIQVFPSIDEEVGNDKRFEIIDNSIFSVKEGDSEKPEVIKIRLVGRVRFRSKAPSQTNEDDMKRNTRTIKYESYVYLGNRK